ncbi:MAG: TonB-dependent receptor [Coraliomargarita sp.]
MIETGRFLAPILAAASLPLVLWASDETHSEDDLVYELEEYVVTSEHSPDYSVLPNDHLFSSVYGNEMGILDTPRNITIISKTQLEAISLKDPRDFTKLTTSSYTGSNFGAPTTPSIRGQIADTLINGMRKGMSINGNGMPLNMNSVESVNILKGPPSIMIGATQYVGGYVDLITKRPTWTNEGQASISADTEGLRKANIDQNFVLSDTVAARFSITGENTDDYYWDDFKRKTFAFYGAVDWQPNERYKLELMSEYFYADYTENWGINRPTQDLIDHNRYVTGTTPVPPGGFLDTVETTGIVKIDREARLHGAGDDSEGDYASFQAIQTFTPDSDLKILNNSLFQYRDRDTYSSYQYSEVLSDNWRFENRTEVQTSQEFLGFLHNLNVGAAFSYQDVWAVNDFYHEPANAWDLVNDSYSDIGVIDDVVFGFNAFPIYGEKARGQLSWRPGSPSATYANADVYAVGNGDSNDSQTTTVGIFMQDQVDLDQHWSLLLGGRLDYVYAESADPMFNDMIRYLRTQDPGVDLTGLKRHEDSHGDFVPNANLGLVYKVTPVQRLYFNYNYSESIPIGAGGGVPLEFSFDPSSPENGKLNEDAFDIQSELFELGYKSSWLDNTVFFTANIFYQTRTEQVSEGDDQEIEAQGFESEFHYQPTEKFYIVAGYSYIDSITKNGLSATRTPIDEVPSVGGSYTINDFVSFSNYDADTPGVPDHIINGLVAYQFTQNLTVTLGLVITSEIDLAFNVPGDKTSTGDPLRSAEIPWQYSVDLGFRYTLDRWEAALYVLNATDEENWGAVNGLYGNDSVYAELPRRFEFTLTAKW